ncbi:MAG: hypothetical protein R3D33_09115 [Hyphomicrobiaceae bacterium]
MTGLRYEVDAEGFASIIWDMPGRSMNVLDQEMLAQFETALASR